MKAEKKYYKTKYHPQYNLSKANIMLYNQILSLDVSTIFEFGCNTGRHLHRLRGMGYEVSGMDINKDFVRSCIQNDLDVKNGDENKLNRYDDSQFDLIFTNSVLCHMDSRSAKKAIRELKRIGYKYLLAFECTSKDNDFWWIHDYKDFETILTEKSHRIGSATYELMICEL